MLVMQCIYQFCKVYGYRITSRSTCCKKVKNKQNFLKMMFVKMCDSFLRRKLFWLLLVLSDNLHIFPCLSCHKFFSIFRKLVFPGKSSVFRKVLLLLK